MSGTWLDPHGVKQCDVPGPNPAVSCSCVAGLVRETAAQRWKSSGAMKLKPQRATLQCLLMTLLIKIFAICAGRSLEAFLAPLPEPGRLLQITFPPSLWICEDQEQKQLSGCLSLAGHLLLLVEHIYDNALCSANDMADATMIWGLNLSRAQGCV